ncbi:c-type cytochrome [Xanthobacter sp. TB0139]|uniref:c-type cytochrome n=1 Tax=Xanthobacter sp. TB0139 TaxID=3459178 RepID=UPI004039B66E
MKKLAVIVVLGLAALAAAYGVALSTPYWFAPKQQADVDIRDPELIARGAYVARAADCVACHTAPGGKPFAGGLGMQTPMGTIYSTNVTPDRESGIGAYSYGDFERAVRRGFRPDGTPLYPAMPYVSYVVVNDADMKALYAYFMSSVEAVNQPNAPTTMPWPLSMRWPLAWWQLLFAQPRSFEVAEGTDPVIARGAYLVEGLAHCGACHTPRGLAFEEKALKNDPAGQYLSGSVLEGWYAKNLRHEARGLSSWSEGEIVDFLKTGRTTHTAAFGSMADVVGHSTQFLTPEDLTAIARYLKQLPARPGHSVEWKPNPDVTTAALMAGDYSAPGAAAYVEHCSLCHRLDGRGAPRIFPALKENSIVFAEDPSSLIQFTLTGGTMAQTPADVMTFTMPGFAKLSNHDVAQILTFIRNGWGNHAAPVTAEEVSQMRGIIENKPVNFVPEHPAKVQGETRGPADEAHNG